MKQPWRPDPEPLKTNDRAAILAGTGLWAVALVVLLILRPPPEHSWWIWTCVTGIAFGGFGYWFVSRMHRRRSRPEETPALSSELPTKDSPAG
ncbi:DUF2530 domain-containing protein [Nonomuraea sp. NPDC046570]|uniref:DUF2530 domain-containing protein n=1 Tax=Nonomuraea sp. NPDC046570 TaxID=3155255 RepID=UPI0033DAF41A